MATNETEWDEREALSMSHRVGPISGLIRSSGGGTLLINKEWVTRNLIFASFYEYRVKEDQNDLGRLVDLDASLGFPSTKKGRGPLPTPPFWSFPTPTPSCAHT